MGKTPAKFENWPNRPRDLASGAPKAQKIAIFVNISNSTGLLLASLLLFLAYKQLIVWSINLLNFRKNRARGLGQMGGVKYEKNV